MRVLKVLVLLIFFITSSITYVHADEIKVDTPKSFGEEVKVLQALGIYGEDINGFDASKAVARGEFATIAVRLMGMAEDVGSSKVTLFSDVPEDNEYYHYISKAVGLRLMSGYDKTRFGINDTIKTEEALKVVVSILGYDVSARQKGGYPDGYITEASSLGLLRGLNTKELEVITWNNLARIINNSLDVPVLKQEGYGDQLAFKSDKTVTLLMDKLDCDWGEGILSSNRDTSLIGNSVIGMGKVEIEHVLYDQGETDADEMLGYHVKFYYRIDGDKSSDQKTLLYIKKTDKNKEIIVNSHDYKGMQGNKFSYAAKDEEVKEIEIANQVDVIFNGHAKPQYNFAEIQANSDQVKLIDNNRDGDIDIVFVNSFVTVVVSKLSADKDTIFDTTNHPAIILDPNDTTKTIQIMNNGSPIKVSQLQKYDVLTITTDEVKVVNSRKMVDIDKAKLYKIDVSFDDIDGTVDEIDDTGIYVDGVHYYVADSYDRINNPIKLGQQLAFQLDSLGRIAFSKPVYTNGSTYGYLINTDKKKGLDQRVRLKIFTAIGDIQVFECIKNVKIDGTVQENVYKALEALDLSADLDGVVDDYRQLIKYETNDQDEVTSIDTLSASVTEDKTTLKMNFSTSTPNVGATMRYKSKGTTIDAQYTVKSNTIIFGVPQRVDDYESYYKLPVSYLKNDSTYKGQIYDATDARSIKVMVISFEAVPSNALCLIQDIKDAINESGEVIRKANAFYAGEAKTLIGKYTYNNSGAKQNVLNGIEKGDIVQIAVDPLGNVTSVTKVISASDLPDISGNARGNYYVERRYAIGEARYLEDSIALIAYGPKKTSSDIGREYYDVANTAAANVYVCEWNHNTLKVRTGSADDIKPISNGYSKPSIVCIDYFWGEPSTVIIYNR